MEATKLTSKQLAFVEHYVTCRNGAEAARLAGYSEKTARQIATENLSKLYIQSTIAKKQDELKREMQIDKERVISELRSAIDVAKVKLDAGSMIRAWVEIAKMLGLYTPEKVAVHVDVATIDRNAALIAKYEAMTDDELLSIINDPVRLP